MARSMNARVWCGCWQFVFHMPVATLNHDLFQARGRAAAPDLDVVQEERRAWRVSSIPEN